MTICPEKCKQNVTFALAITRRWTSSRNTSRIKSTFRELKARQTQTKCKGNRTPSTVNSFTTSWWLTSWWGTQRMIHKASRTFKRSWAKVLLRSRSPLRSFSRFGRSTCYPIYIMVQVSWPRSTTPWSLSCTSSMVGGSGLASTFKNVNCFTALRTSQSSTKFCWRWNLPPFVFTRQWINQFLKKTSDFWLNTS